MPAATAIGQLAPCNSPTVRVPTPLLAPSSTRPATGTIAMQQSLNVVGTPPCADECVVGVHVSRTQARGIPDNNRYTNVAPSDWAAACSLPASPRADSSDGSGSGRGTTTLASPPRGQVSKARLSSRSVAGAALGSSVNASEAVTGSCHTSAFGECTLTIAASNTATTMAVRRHRFDRSIDWDRGFAMSSTEGAGVSACEEAGYVFGAQEAGVRGKAGTPGFWAPEMLYYERDGKGRRYGPAADFWSLGCLIYALLAAKGPFTVVGGDTADDNAATLQNDPDLSLPVFSPDARSLLHVSAVCVTCHVPLVRACSARAPCACANHNPAQ